MGLVSFARFQNMVDMIVMVSNGHKTAVAGNELGIANVYPFDLNIRDVGVHQGGGPAVMD